MNRTAKAILAFLLALLPNVQGWAQSWNPKLQIQSPNEAPVSGAVDLEITFMQDGGKTPLLTILKNDVPVVQGIAKPDIKLTPSQRQTVFSASGRVVVQFRELKSGRVFPPMEIGAVPFARTVPLDTNTLALDSLGRIGVRNGSIPSKQSLIDQTSDVAAGQVTLQGSNGLHVSPYGSALGETGEIRFFEPDDLGGHYVGFKSPDTVGASVIWELPDGDGTPAQVLTTDGSKNLLWATPVDQSAATLCADGFVLDGDGTCYARGALSELGEVSGGTGGTITDGSLTNIDVAAGAAIQNDKLAVITTPGKVSGDAITSGTIAGSTIILTSATITVGDTVVRGDLTVSPSGTASELRLHDNAGGEHLAIKAPATRTGSHIWTLPSVDGSANQLLKVDGAANLGWVNQPTVGVTSLNGSNNDVVLDHSDVGGIDTSEKGANSGVASLNGLGKVLQEPATAAVTPAADGIVRTGGSSTIDLDWLPTALTGKNADSVDGIQGASLALASTLLSTGAGLSGGANLSANRTVDLKLFASGGLQSNLGGTTDKLGISTGGVGSSEIGSGEVSSDDINAGAVTNAKINAIAGIDPSKVHDGSVDATEFAYLDGVTSAIQTQLSAKGDILEGGQPSMVTVGTSDASDLTLMTNNLSRLTLSSGGLVGIGSLTPATSLDVNGAIKFGASSTCTAAETGTIRYQGGDFEGCDGSTWLSFTAAGGLSSQCRISIQTADTSIGRGSSTSGYSSGSTEQCTNYLGIFNDRIRACITCQ